MQQTDIPSVRVKKLRYSHPKGKGNIPALTDLSFSLKPGELMCLAGVNGTGKSTLLCLLAGVYPCEPEQLFLFGVDQAGVGSGAAMSGHMAVLAPRQAALLMQDADMQLLGASVEEDLLLGLPETPEIREKAHSLAARFSLDTLLQSPPHTLSYGQKRKLCLAGALLRGASLLLLDEPFSGLDYPAVKELRNILMECKAQGITLVVSTHDLEPVLDFTDSILFLAREGAVFGRTTDVLDQAALLGVRPPVHRSFP